MLISILLCLCFLLSFIFNGYIENIFIILSTILFYKKIILDKDYKYLIVSFIISIVTVNFLIVFGFRNYINFKDIKSSLDKKDTLVLLVSEGEDSRFNLKERATQIYYEKRYKSLLTGVKDLYNYKNYYNKLGSSNFKLDTEEIAQKLRYNLGDGYDVINTYMYSSPYFEKTMEEIVYQGYKNIIVCPLFMTEGRDYEIFKSRYEKLNLASHNLVGIEILEPFYKSNNLANLYKNEILNNVKTLENDAGILLVGLHNKNNLEQDILFREKIKTYIENETQDKNIDIQIKLPLLENNKNDIIKSGEELLEYGIDTLYVVFPTCTIDTMYTKHLVKSIFENLDMGNTKFYYIDPDKKIDVIVDELFTRISLMKQIGG